MGYEMYRQLTYTTDDNPYDRTREIPNTNKKIVSAIELNNIERYRKSSMTNVDIIYFDIFQGNIYVIQDPI
jgi:hypothetical protein